jgi:hypothetical protein
MSKVRKYVKNDNHQTATAHSNIESTKEKNKKKKKNKEKEKEKKKTKTKVSNSPSQLLTFTEDQKTRQFGQPVIPTPTTKSQTPSKKENRKKGK